MSGQEEKTASIIENYLTEKGLKCGKILNNVWAVGSHFDSNKPTLLLNSHHDTVKPVAGYTHDPFKPIIEEGRIYGLGSNDAGASVVALIETFLRLQDQELNVNLLLGISAEEEISGKNGIVKLLEHFHNSNIKIDMAIVGEPTKLQAAIAERGLMVLDCEACGKSGHAARNEGVNAIYIAMECIERVRNIRFDKISPTLGAIKATVTQISAGTQHNVIPDLCKFVIDVRTTDAYTNEETLEIFRKALPIDVKARSTRLNASVISEDHPLVTAAVKLGVETFVSPTLSDRSLMKGIPALKIGPGDSARSHTADEYVMITEIEDAIKFYCELILSL